MSEMGKINWVKNHYTQEKGNGSETGRWWTETSDVAQTEHENGNIALNFCSDKTRAGNKELATDGLFTRI